MLLGASTTANAQAPFLAKDFNYSGTLPEPNLVQSVLNAPTTFNGSVANVPSLGDAGRSYRRTADGQR